MTTQLPDTTESQAELSREVAHARAFIVKDAASYTTALLLTQRVKAHIRRVVGLFRESKQATHHAHQAVCHAEKSLLGPAEECERLYKRKAEACYREQQRQRQAQEQSMAAELGQRVTLPSTVPEVDGAEMREPWDFRIVDAAKVPDEYKLIDEAKIRRVVKALKGETHIPGVEVFQGVTAAVSARSE